MDNVIWSSEFEKNKKLTAGTLLLSEPFLEDENFKRKVILVCKHHPLEGTTGLVLNQPIQLRIQDLLPGFPLDFKANLALGGPVGTDLIQMIHTLGSKIEGSKKLCDGVYWGGDFEQLKKYIRKGEISPNSVRFFVGYSGWDAPQIQEEILESTWILHPANGHFVFPKNYDLLWKTVLKEMGGIYTMLANYPESPTLN